MEFSHPYWLWMLLAIPLICGLFFLYYQRRQPHHQLEKFVDSHLIPHLLLEGGGKKKKLWTHLFFWSLVWSFLVVAMAGPRWNFREISTYTRDQNLVILLDLSESMNAKDISPSRLTRAKQKIEDLLNMSKGVKIGLIAFAADPHMIAPMTEDKETIRHHLLALDTDLVYIQGSKLTPALEMAAAMLGNEPGDNKAIVVVSDGGFEDASCFHTAKKLAEKGVALHAIGVGSLEGAPLQVKKNGAVVMSKLEKEKFREISKIGHGRYFDADHAAQVALIFDDLEKHSNVLQKEQKTQRIWEEHFYLLLLPALPFLLWWYRRGSIFLLLFLPIFSEASLTSYFYNGEQKGGQAYEKEDYTAAIDSFQDPYRKGVAHYRLGDYAKAEEMFRKSTRKEVARGAGYNLGNALAFQNKLREAIKAYEDVLEKWPDHKEAKENLELIKQMLEDQKKEDQKDKQDQEQEQKQDRDQDQEQEQEQKQEQEDQKQEEQQEDQEKKETPRSQEDLDADLWLDQIKNDPKPFLKNKFYLESKKNGTKEEIDPW